MSCALITGVEGFTGRYLARELSLCGHSVAGIGINPCPVDLQLQQYKQVDLSDPSATAVAIAAMRPDLVFHLAGISHVQSSPDAIYRINVAATRNLLAALAALETPPGFTLLASTANLYGNSGGVLKETAVPDPHNDYAVSKLAMEYMANIWRDRLPITIVRPFNYTGRGQATSFLIPKLVQHFREKLPLIELGNVDVVREFGDVRDVAAFYVRLAEVKAPWGPFNICSGIGYSLNDVLEMLQAMTGIHPKIRINQAFVRPNEVHTLIGSPERLKACIGPLRIHNLKNTLQWMLEE